MPFYTHVPSCRGPGVVIVTALVATSAGTLRAQQHHSHEDAPGHHQGLHFSHPLVTESVSPDTKLRVNAARAFEADGTETEFDLEGEYAFHRAFSIEVGVPFAVLDPDDAPSASRLGNLEVLFKFANYAFERHGLLLGYGLEFGLPTGDDARGIGSDHLWEMEPFLNLGYRRGRIELVGWSRFGVPFNQNAGDEVETEFAYDLSALVHVTPRFQGLLEVNGETVLSGDEAGETVVLLSPGVKVAPAAGVPLFIGAGASVPLTDTELDVAARVSLFYHF